MSNTKRLNSADKLHAMISSYRAHDKKVDEALFHVIIQYIKETEKGLTK